jgi:hypothetical protein
MHRQLNAVILLVGLASVTFTITGHGGTVKAADWTIVWQDPAAYEKLPGEEVLLRGELEVENYGKPDVKYGRAPLRYWLWTDGRKLAVSPPRDSLLLPLDGRVVEVKGKIQTDPQGHETVWVRSIRPADTASESR